MVAITFVQMYKTKVHIHGLASDQASNPAHFPALPSRRARFKIARIHQRTNIYFHDVLLLSRQESRFTGLSGWYDENLGSERFHTRATNDEALRVEIRLEMTDAQLAEPMRDR